MAVMGFGVADLAIGTGVVTIVLGLAMSGFGLVVLTVTEAPAAEAPAAEAAVEPGRKSEVGLRDSGFGGCEVPGGGVGDSGKRCPSSGDERAGVDVDVVVGVRREVAGRVEGDLVGA